MKQQTALLIIATGLVAGCSSEQPPRTTTEFLENPMLLEAAMVRCAQDRAGTRYDAECINARDAVKRIEAKEEAARRADMEARSTNKRQALRRTQEAAAAARRRSAEAESQRKEAEYLAQFGVPLTAEVEAEPVTEEFGNTPQAVISEPAESTDDAEVPARDINDTEPGSDLDAIRDELRRRNEDSES